MWTAYTPENKLMGNSNSYRNIDISKYRKKLCWISNRKKIDINDIPRKITNALNKYCAKLSRSRVSCGRQRRNQTTCILYSILTFVTVRWWRLQALQIICYLSVRLRISSRSAHAVLRLFPPQTTMPTSGRRLVMVSVATKFL